jgi:hypothetical protein
MKPLLGCRVGSIVATVAYLDRRVSSS